MTMKSVRIICSIAAAAAVMLPTAASTASPTVTHTASIRHQKNFYLDVKNRTTLHGKQYSVEVQMYVHAVGYTKSTGGDPQSSFLIVGPVQRTYPSKKMVTYFETSAYYKRDKQNVVDLHPNDSATRKRINTALNADRWVEGFQQIGFKADGAKHHWFAQRYYCIKLRGWQHSHCYGGKTQWTGKSQT